MSLIRDDIDIKPRDSESVTIIAVCIIGSVLLLGGWWFATVAVPYIANAVTAALN